MSTDIQKLFTDGLTDRLGAHAGKIITPELIAEIKEDVIEYVEEFLETDGQDEDDD